MNIIIKGHQRSGNNYLIHLLGFNFFRGTYDTYSFSDGDDHVILNELKDGFKYLYIKRNKESVLKSVFKERALYGIAENNFDTFIKTPYIKMFDPAIKSKQNHITMVKATEYDMMQNDFFSCIEKTPDEWYCQHLEKYSILAEKNTNLLIVSYDELINNFESEMNKISLYLFNGTAMPYANINIKVGWVTVG